MYANLESYDGAVLVYINDDGYQEDVCNNNLSTGIVEELAKLILNTQKSEEQSPKLQQNKITKKLE